MKKLFTIVAAVMVSFSLFAEGEAVYNWSNVEADQVGVTVLGANGVEVTTVKIHTNQDAFPCLKFGSSYVFAEGKYVAIKPAEGKFQAGDVLSVAVVFNNSDDTKYCMVDVFAADTETRLWRSDSASTINGRTSAAEPIVQTYTLEAEQDSLLLGRYGNTGMCVTLLNVVRGDEPIEPIEVEYYDVAEAIAGFAALDSTEITVNGVITKIEFKGKNFAKYGSANIYVKDATGAEGTIEFYNCYSMLADTFRTSSPEFDATSTAWGQFNSITDGNGVTVTVGDTVKAFGKFIQYNGTYELAQGCFLTEINPTEVEPAPIVPDTLTCAEVYAKAKNDAVIMHDVVVTYVNGKNVWVKDETGSMLIYLSAEATWKAGDVLAGVAGVVDVYNGIHEIKPTAEQVAAVVATAGEAPAPEELAAVLATDVNKYIVLKGIQFAEAAAFAEGTASNINIIVGGESVVLRNNFKNAYSFEAGKLYDIIAVVSLYKEAAQLYFIEASEAQGIENIVLGEKAQKVVVDGAIYIVRDGKLFDVRGAQVR